MADEVIRESYPVMPGSRLNTMMSRISWGAIWAGVMVALGFEVLFSLFGLWIGFSMFNPQAANPWGGVSVWTTIWYFVTAWCSIFAGAWCAGMLSGSPLRRDRVMHGITTWGMATFGMILLAGLSGWAVVRNAIFLMATRNAPALGATPQGTASAIASTALVLWIGVLVGLIAAYVGSLAARPRTLLAEGQEVPVGPRRAA